MKTNNRTTISVPTKTDKLATLFTRSLEAFAEWRMMGEAATEWEDNAHWCRGLAELADILDAIETSNDLSALAAAGVTLPASAAEPPVGSSIITTAAAAC